MWHATAASSQQPAAADPDAPKPATESDNPKKILACLPCSKAKLKCDTAVPCTRCFRNNLACVQLLWRPPKKPKKRKPSPSSAAPDGGAALKEGDNEKEKPKGRKRRAVRKLREREPPLVDDRPIVELALSRTDPGVAAGLFVQAFYRLYAEGTIMRPSVLTLMRVWRTWSIAAGTDVTWGVLDKLAEALHVTAAELEGPELLAFGVPDAVRRQRAQQAAAEIQSLQGQIPPELRAPRGDIDQDKALVITILPCYDARAPLMQQYSNAKYGRMIKAIGDLQSDVVRYRAVQVLLLVALIAPDDREHYLHGFSRVFLTDSQPFSLMVKASYGDGQVRLYLMSCRRIMLSDGRVAVVHQIEPCPKSRHVTDMPDTAFHLVRKFRLGEDADADAAAAASVTTTTSSSRSRPNVVHHGAAASPPPKAQAAGAVAGAEGGPIPFPPVAAWVLSPEANAKQVALEGKRQLEMLVRARVAAAEFQMQGQKEKQGEQEAKAQARRQKLMRVGEEQIKKKAGEDEQQQAPRVLFALPPSSSSAPPAGEQSAPLFHGLLVPHPERKEVKRPPSPPPAVRAPVMPIEAGAAPLLPSPLSKLRYYQQQQPLATLQPLSPGIESALAIGGGVASPGAVSSIPVPVLAGAGAGPAAAEVDELLHLFDYDE